MEIILCKICNEKFPSNAITKHIKKVHNLSSEQYYKMHVNETSGVCPHCNKPTRFRNIISGYSIYCSIACVNKSDIHKQKSKETFRKKYDVENPSQSTEIKNKKKNTLLKNYGVEHPLQSDVIKEKYKETSLSRYNEEHPLKSGIVQQKIENTCEERYGIRRVLQSEAFLDKVKTTNRERFGVEWAIQSEQIREKQTETYLNNYGVEHPFIDENVKDKIKKTNLTRYGCEYSSQSTIVKEKARQTSIKTYYNRLINSDRFKELVTPLFSMDDYIGVGASTADRVYYSWKCNQCYTIFKDHILNGNIPRCPVCYPKLAKTDSFGEQELYYFISSLGVDVVKSDRTVLDGKEIDIYIQDKRVGVEFNGLYYHSELNNKDRRYHLYKTELAESKNVTLLHVFEDEWVKQKNIVKSIIKAKLNLLEDRIYARKCNIKLVSTEEANIFLFDNHIQGYVSAGVNVGLYYKGKLCAILTMGKSRYNKKYEWELLRFCNKINTVVVGGFSKLYNYFVNQYTPKNVITYVDRRYGVGKFYIKSGFIHNGATTPSYYYTKYVNRENRMKYQKHLLSEKLDVYDSTLTEWENMQLNGFDRVWDCGNMIYVWESR